MLNNLVCIDSHIFLNAVLYVILEAVARSWTNVRTLFQIETVVSLAIILSMRGIHFPIILLLLLLWLVLSTNLPNLILRCIAVFICCWNLCFYFLGHLLVQLVLSTHLS